MRVSVCVYVCKHTHTHTHTETLRYMYIRICDVYISTGYNREGFLVLQRAITLSVITEWNPTAAHHTIDIMLKRHPYPPYAEDSFVNLLQTQFPFIVMLSFIIAAPSICKDICLEKEKRLKVTHAHTHIYMRVCLYK